MRQHYRMMHEEDRNMSDVLHMLTSRSEDLDECHFYVATSCRHVWLHQTRYRALIFNKAYVHTGVYTEPIVIAASVGSTVPCCSVASEGASSPYACLYRAQKVGERLIASIRILNFADEEHPSFSPRIARSFILQTLDETCILGRHATMNPAIPDYSARSNFKIYI